MKAKRRYTHAVMPHVFRMIALRRAGLSCNAVAIVCNLDFGTYYTAVQVRGFTTRHSGVQFPRGIGQVSKDTGKNLPRKAAA